MQSVLNKWESKSQLVELLSRLVEFKSITKSKEEITIAEAVAEKLKELSYFQKNKDYVKLHSTEDGRLIVTALVKKSKDVRNTVILVSHFDVVDVEDYGQWKDMAFDVRELTNAFYTQKESMPLEVRKDLEQGDWLFGRGTMDMKCGLVSHMSMIEKATSGAFEGNVLLLGVCDEEVNSVGMRTAVPVLLDLAEKHNLEYKACLNSEPIFTRYPGDHNKYIYTGSIGKVLPGFFCYGKEAHVGEPFSGLNANYMASQITCQFELNTDFCEVVEGEATPAPTNLIQKDFKKEYSAQTPHRAVTLFNLFFMEKSMDELIEQLRLYTEKTARQIEESYVEKLGNVSEFEKSNLNKMEVKVITFEELMIYAVQMFGKEKVEHIRESIKELNNKEDERDVTIHFVDKIASLCKELAPMIVIFFAPPYYPAVSSRKDIGITQIVEELIDYAKDNHGVVLEQQNYFPGMSDLSYTGLPYPISSLESLISNMPLWENGYSLPLKELEELNLPVLNLGPLGKDAHKWTERLEVNYAFETLNNLLQVTINKLLK